MNRELSMEKYMIEAWGLWWVQWQNEMKSKLRKQALEPVQPAIGTGTMINRLNRFTELHLSSSLTDGKCLGGDAAAPTSTNLSN